MTLFALSTIVPSVRIPGSSFFNLLPRTVNSLHSQTRGIAPPSLQYCNRYAVGLVQVQKSGQKGLVFLNSVSLFHFSVSLSFQSLQSSITHPALRAPLQRRGMRQDQHLGKWMIQSPEFHSPRLLVPKSPSPSSLRHFSVIFRPSVILITLN
jgi:hypothetical protein